MHTHYSNLPADLFFLVFFPKLNFRRKPLIISFVEPIITTTAARATATAATTTTVKQQIFSRTKSVNVLRDAHHIQYGRQSVG